MNPFYRVVFSDQTYTDIMAPNGNAAKTKAQKRYADKTIIDVYREIPTSGKEAIKHD